jgi:hypothetical protein
VCACDFSFSVDHSHFWVLFSVATWFFFLSSPPHLFNLKVSSRFFIHSTRSNFFQGFNALFDLYYRSHPHSLCLNQRPSMAQMCLFCTGIDITSLNPDPWSTIDTPQISSISSCSRHLHRLFPLYDCYAHLSSLTTPDLLLHSPHHWRLLYVYPAYLLSLSWQP